MCQKETKGTHIKTMHNISILENTAFLLGRTMPKFVSRLLSQLILLIHIHKFEISLSDPILGLRITRLSGIISSFSSTGIHTKACLELPLAPNMCEFAQSIKSVLVRAQQLMS